MKRIVSTFAVAAGIAAASTGAAFGGHSGNLILNGGAELGAAGTDDSAIVAPQGWSTLGHFTAVKYGSSGLPDVTASTPIHGGATLFAGGPDNASSSAKQMVTVPQSWWKTVSAGRATAMVSADLGGWEGQSDAATVNFVFLDASGATAGSVKIGPITPETRSNETGLMVVRKSVPVPAATRSIRVTISAIRGTGDYNDGYIDNVSLTLAT